MPEVDPRNPDPYNKDKQPFDEYGRPYIWNRGDTTPGMLYSPGGIGKVKEYADRDWLANFIKLHPGFWIPEIGHILSGGDRWTAPGPITKDELKAFEQRKLEGQREIARGRARSNMTPPPKAVNPPKPVVVPPTSFNKGGFVPEPPKVVTPPKGNPNAGFPIKRRNVTPTPVPSPNRSYSLPVKPRVTAIPNEFRKKS